MARTRAQRRRHTLLLTVALVVTLVVLLFAHDVSRAAHNALSPRRSENRSFAALANALLSEENQFDARLSQLLSGGATLSRPVFAARLSQLDDQLPQWSSAAQLLRQPVLAHHVGEALFQITQDRVAAYEAMLQEIARALALPWRSSSSSVVTNPASTLEVTSALWNVERFALNKEPGRAHLDSTSAFSATTFAAKGVGPLVHSGSLALRRAIGIAAVQVSPAPLPAPKGVLLLPPVTSVHLGVSVWNAAYDDQPVTLSVTVTPLNGRGAAYTQTIGTTIGPLQGYAFVPALVKTAASERADVVVSIRGAPSAGGMVTTKTYRLELSPSGD